MQRDLRWNHLPAGKKKKESEILWRYSFIVSNATEASRLVCVELLMSKQAKRL